jgi:hypothetical protein
MGKLTDGQTDRQTERQAGRQTGIQAYRQTCRQADSRQADRQRGRQAERQTDRQIDIWTDRLTHRQADRQAGREREFTLYSSRAAMNVFGSNDGSVTTFPPQWSVGRLTTFSPKMWKSGKTQIVVGWNVSENHKNFVQLGFSLSNCQNVQLNTDFLKHKTHYFCTERNGQLKLNEIKKNTKLKWDQIIRENLLSNGWGSNAKVDGKNWATNF